MRKDLLKLLIDPVSRKPLELNIDGSREADSIQTGNLAGPGGRTFEIRNGIPRFVVTHDLDQKQTQSSFGYKWEREDTYNSAGMRDFTCEWIPPRYGFASKEEMRAYFAGCRRILDAGCGGGFTTSIWMTDSWQGSGNAQWVGVDISSAIDVAQERLGKISGTHFVQADVLNLPFGEKTFDAIFSEGVLHHTPSTEKAIKSLASLLTPGGELLFYVYRKKGPMREFADDFIRGELSSLPPAKAWEALKPLTKLGKALSDLHAEVMVEEDIPYLGIKAGRYDVQRLFYWHFAKMFWNQSFAFEENNHINFDWYHPAYAHRQTEEEVRRWCQEANLSVVHFNTQESGFTVRARSR